MAFEQRPNSGQLFQNRNKKNPKAPDLTGEGLLELPDGSEVKVDLAGWRRTTKTGAEWISLAIKVKDDDDVRF